MNSRSFIKWNKNGDCPGDDVFRPFEDTGLIPIESREGKLVRYFRSPNIPGEEICLHCSQPFNKHGWVDVDVLGMKICPGNVIEICQIEKRVVAVYKKVDEI